jgi:raffinose/stachyose/melibiose transport system substrate-binding protein
MISRRVRRRCAVLSSVLAVVAATACNSGGGTVSTQGVTLSVWQPSAFNPQQADLVKGFTQASGIQLDVLTIPDPYQDNLITKWATGARPDILWNQSVVSIMAKLGVTKSMQDLSDMPFNNNYISKATAAGGLYSNGKRYAVPVDYPSVFSIYYNKNVFQKYGLTVPKNGADLLAVCDKLKGTGITPIYTGEGDKWPPSVLFWNLWADVAGDDSMVAALNSGKAHLTDKPFVDSANLVVNLKNAGCFEKDLFTSTYVGQQKAVMSGQAAIMANGSWTLPSLASLGYTSEQIDSTLGFLQISLSGQHLTSGAAAGFYAPKTGDAAHEAAARKFIEYVAGGAGYGPYISASKELPIFKGFQNPTGISQLLIDMDTAAQTNGVPNLGDRLQADFTGSWVDYMAELLNGQLTAEAYCSKLDNNLKTNARLLGLPGF